MQTPPEKSPRQVPGVRRRDRHGRGLRGMLIPPGVPLYRTRAERFDDLVLQAVARLEPQWEAHLSAVEFAVEEIPPPDMPPGSGRGPVPLSRLDPGVPEGAEPGGEGIRRDALISPELPGPPPGEAPTGEPPPAAGDAAPGDDPAGGDPAGGDPAGGDPAGGDLPSGGSAGGGSAIDDSARDSVGEDGAGGTSPAGGPAAGELSAGSLSGAGPHGGEPAEPGPPRIVVYRRPLLARADTEEELGELVFDVVVEEFGRLLGIDPSDVDSGYSGGA